MVSEREQAVVEAFEQLRPFLSYDDVKAEYDIENILQKVFDSGKNRGMVFFHQIDPVVESTMIDGDEHSGKYGVIRFHGQGRYPLGSLSFTNRRQIQEVIYSLASLWKKMDGMKEE